MSVRGAFLGRKANSRLASVGSLVVAVALVAGCTSDDGGDGDAELEQTEPDADADQAEDGGDEGADADDTDADATDPDSDGDDIAGVGPCGEPEDVPEITVGENEYDSPHEMSIDESATYQVTIDTTCGDIVLELDAEAAPNTVNNLVNLAEDGFYDGVIFHRVINGFMAQVGDPTGTGAGGPGYSFEDELDLAEQVFEDVGNGYPRGTVAMANSGPNTNGSQFFLSQGDPTVLPGPDYTVFGTVVEGMDVVDDIVASPTDQMDKPMVDIAIRSVTVDIT